MTGGMGKWVSAAGRSPLIPLLELEEAAAWRAPGLQDWPFQTVSWNPFLLVHSQPHQK